MLLRAPPCCLFAACSLLRRFALLLGPVHSRLICAAVRRAAPGQRHAMRRRDRRPVRYHRLLGSLSPLTIRLSSVLFGPDALHVGVCVASRRRKAADTSGSATTEVSTALTSHLVPRTTHLLPLTSHRGPLTSFLSPRSSHLSSPASSPPQPGPGLLLRTTLRACSTQMCWRSSSHSITQRFKGC